MISLDAWSSSLAETKTCSTCVYSLEQVGQTTCESALTIGLTSVMPAIFPHNVCVRCLPRSDTRSRRGPGLASLPVFGLINLTAGSAATNR